VVGTPDDRWIEAVTAYVVVKQEVTPEELVAHSKRSLAGFKVPKAVHLVDALPRNQSGKLLKRVLRDG
jgi:fatty-acyl-CoA synthase